MSKGDNVLQQMLQQMVEAGAADTAPASVAKDVAVKVQEEEEDTPATNVPAAATVQQWDGEACDREYARLKVEAAQRLGPEGVAAMTKAERSRMRSELWRQVKKEQASRRVRNRKVTL